MCVHMMCCRYVVCKGYLDVERNVSRYLLDVNDKLNEMKGSEEDVLEVRRSSSVAPLYACTYVCMYVHTVHTYVVAMRVLVAHSLLFGIASSKALYCCMDTHIMHVITVCK